MKTVKTIMTILVVLVFTSNTFAQTSKWNISAGINIIPSMTIDLKNTKSGMSNTSGLAATVNFAKGNDMFALNYSSGNAIGGLYFRTLSEHYGVYLSASKNVFDKGSSIGLGCTRKVGSNYLLVAVGSGLDQVSPSATVGVLIPITFNLSK